jgi:hypothetical protein
MSPVLIADVRDGEPDAYLQVTLKWSNSAVDWQPAVFALDQSGNHLAESWFLFHGQLQVPNERDPAGDLAMAHGEVTIRLRPSQYLARLQRLCCVLESEPNSSDAAQCSVEYKIITPTREVSLPLVQTINPTSRFCRRRGHRCILCGLVSQCWPRTK